KGLPGGPGGGCGAACLGGGLGGGFLAAGQDPGGVVHLTLGDGGGGQPGGGGMAGGTADGAGEALLQVPGQESCPLGVEGPQQGGVTAGSLVGGFLGVQVAALGPAGGFI